MKFEDLQLKLNTDTTEVKYEDFVIQVKQYLPVADKITLVQIALQQSLEDGVYNEGLLTAYFHTYVVMFYTDLEFTDEEKHDILSVFDKLQTEGFIFRIFDAIPKEEIDDLTDLLYDQKNIFITYKQSTAYLIGQFINNLPQQMEQVSEIINNFDPSKYQAVIDFATAANGGRNINTNKPVE